MTDTTVKVPKKEEVIISQEPQPVMNLLEIAMKSSEVDLDKMDKIMQMYERFQAKEAEKSYYKAMNLFQSNKPDLIKSAKVDYASKAGRVQYSYNPLPKIQKKIDPVLSDVGLSYKWKQESNDNKIKITCIVSHVDGYFEETWLEAGHDTTGSKNAIQAIGSTVTYLKRYTLENALGLSSGVDDDGAASNGSKPPRTLEELTPIIKTAKTFGALKKVWDSCSQAERSLSNDVFAAQKVEIKNIELDLIAEKDG